MLIVVDINSAHATHVSDNLDHVSQRFASLVVPGVRRGMPSHATRSAIIFEIRRLVTTAWLPRLKFRLCISPLMPKGGNRYSALRRFDFAITA